MRVSAGIRSFSAQATAVAFPLGGIGTGTISLGARGELRDWEIFNRPDKGRFVPAFFAIRAQAAGAPPVAKVLEGPLQLPNTAEEGYPPLICPGLPRMHGATFRGEYPPARIEFADSDSFYPGSFPIGFNYSRWRYRPHRRQGQELVRCLGTIARHHPRNGHDRCVHCWGEPPSA